MVFQTLEVRARAALVDEPEREACHGERRHAQASAGSERTRSGAIVPATTADSAKCTKPCSDDAMPRIVGKRSSISSVAEGMTSADPMQKTKIGSTFHATPGGSDQHVSEVERDAGEDQRVADAHRPLRRAAPGEATRQRSRRS